MGGKSRIAKMPIETRTQNPYDKFSDEKMESQIFIGASSKCGTHSNEHEYTVKHKIAEVKKFHKKSTY